jgi:hypothetical protein
MLARCFYMIFAPFNHFSQLNTCILTCTGRFAPLAVHVPVGGRCPRAGCLLLAAVHMQAPGRQPVWLAAAQSAGCRLGLAGCCTMLAAAWAGWPASNASHHQNAYVYIIAVDT